MADDNYSSFLGTGWSFPPAFSGGGVEMVGEEADIEESLRILFGTSPGERFLRPDYGLFMRELLFEPLTTTFTTFLKDRINIAILVYEPRIRVVGLEINDANALEGRLDIVLEYEVRSTNSRFNLVFPFYSRDSNEMRPALPAPRR